jgi:6-methylsalicylate decarboxylase
MRIDVQEHIMPPFYAEAMPAHGGDPSDSPVPKWSIELAVSFMDAHEIATGIVSLSSLSVVGWSGNERRQMVGV